MTEKRFNDAKGYVYDGKKCIGIIVDDYTCENIINLLNTFHDENEQLKQAYTQLEDRHSLLHDECIDAECDRDTYRKDIVSLEKENEKLKQQNKEFIELIRHCYENWSEEKKKMVGEISNGLLGDMND